MASRLWSRIRGGEAGGVALVVDGPNVLRNDFDVDLSDVRQAGERLGRLAVTRLYVDEHATPGLIRAAEVHGFEVIVTSGDVDVRLSVETTALIAEGTIDTLAVVSRDADFKPLVEYANRRGIETVAIAPGSFGRSEALRNAAGRAITLDEPGV